MLKQQTSLSLSPYTQLYDALTPKDNFLRQMHDLVDFREKEIKQSLYTLKNKRNFSLL
ncbi:hypothetical protein [Amphibacillus cookii]|uniref:hypothetical protein n=1 Tax=Amphibacillus cookii TaxID=767787 RepID=UPI00195980F1|nr:hypothetical protein [Amphibacillus cookii]MBM7540516.1 hypothetical protein [Amphibacillus cookii]